MRAPAIDHLARSPLLGTLAVLEMALVVLARGLRAAHGGADRAPLDDDPVLEAARRLSDDAELLLSSLDRYRDQLDAATGCLSADPDWPF
jgi:hypothetical protein